MRRALFSALFATALVLPASAQQAAQPAPRQLVDRIVVVVGDTILLNSDVEEQLQLLEAAGRQLPRNDSAAFAAVRRQVIDQMVENLVLLQAAQRDSTIRIDETRVTAEVDKQVEERKARIGGDAAFQEALTKQQLTLNEWREMLSSDIRKEMQRNQYLQQRFSGRKAPPITESDLRKQFETEKSQLPTRPATVTFHQVVIAATSEAARTVARAKADSLWQAVSKGEDFEALAKRVSDDVATREAGGDLGWFRPSQMVTEFGNAVMRMRPGEISPVVETTYGFHIIKLEKVRGAERQARHILIRPVTSEEGAQEVTARAAQLADRIRAGADIDSMAAAIGDPGEKVRVGPIEPAQLKEVAPAYDQHLSGVKTGDVVGPFRIGGEGGTPEKVVIAKVVDVREAGPYSWDDPLFREQYRRRVEQTRLVGEIIGELKRQTYIDIRQ